LPVDNSVQRTRTLLAGFIFRSGIVEACCEASLRDQIFSAIQRDVVIDGSGTSFTQIVLVC